MTNEVTTKQNKTIEYMVNDNKIKLSMNIVRDNLVDPKANVSDQEVMNFIMLASHNKLDPFLKEVYLVKFNGKPAQMIVSKEAFMKRADANDSYDGFEAGIIVERDGKLIDEVGTVQLSSDKLIGGWAHVYRKDRKMPIVSRISLREFSKGQSTWNAMPATMIRKTAIVNALREAFPQNLGAMYTEEEQQPIDVTGQSDERTDNAINKIANMQSSAAKSEAPIEQNTPSDQQPEIINVDDNKQANREVFENKIKDNSQSELFDEFANIPDGNGAF